MFAHRALQNAIQCVDDVSIPPHTRTSVTRSVGDDEQAQQELKALSDTVQRFHDAKRRKYAQQRDGELDALKQGIEAAVAHAAQLAEQEKQAATADIQVCACKGKISDTAAAIQGNMKTVANDVQRMLKEYEQVREWAQGHAVHTSFRHVLPCCTSCSASMQSWRRPASARCAVCKRCVAIGMCIDQRCSLQVNQTRQQTMQATLAKVMQDLDARCKALVEESTGYVLWYGYNNKMCHTLYYKASGGGLEARNQAHAQLPRRPGQTDQCHDRFGALTV